MTEIPDGELICPRCVSEINLVPDYRPVVFMIDEKKQEDKKSRSKDEKLFRKSENAEKEKNRRQGRRREEVHSS